MVVALFLLLTPMLTTNVVSAACGVHVFVPSPSHDDYTRRDYLLWSRNRTHSLGVCGAACVDDVKCVCFQYSVHLSACKAYSASLERLNASASVEGPGYKTFLLQKAYTSIGSVCDHTDPCGVNNSVCVNGICGCEDGYTFHAPTGQCNKTAGENDCTFSMQMGFEAASATPFRTSNVAKVGDCRATCTESIEPCLAFQFHKNTLACAFYSQSNHDLKEDPDWTYGARQSACT